MDGSLNPDTTEIDSQETIEKGIANLRDQETNEFSKGVNEKFIALGKLISAEEFDLDQFYLQYKEINASAFLVNLVQQCSDDHILSIIWFLNINIPEAIRLNSLQESIKPYLRHEVSVLKEKISYTFRLDGEGFLVKTQEE